MTSLSRLGHQTGRPWDTDAIAEGCEWRTLRCAWPDIRSKPPIAAATDWVEIAPLCEARYGEVVVS
jgi:hypothetical protein